MQDKDILKWIEDHLTSFRLTLEEIDDNGNPQKSKGKNLIDCVNKANFLNTLIRN